MSEENLKSNINEIYNHIDYLDNIKDQNKEKFLESPERIKAVKYSMKAVMDGCLTITRDIVMGGEEIRTTGSYIDMFDKLEEEKIIDENLSKKIIKVIRLRTKFNPFDGEVTDKKVLEVMNEYIPHIERYLENINEFSDQ